MKNTEPSAHHAAVEAYLGAVRAVSEEFVAAYREQIEVLRELADNTATAAAEIDGPQPADPPGPRQVDAGRPARSAPDPFNSRSAP